MKQQLRRALTDSIARTAARLSHRSSSPFPTNHQTNTHFAKPITLDGLTFCATNVVELYEDPTSQHWIANTTSSILLAQYVLQSSGRKIAITNTKEMSTVITTTQLASHKDVMAVTRRFLSNSWKSSEMGKINTGIQSVI